MPDAPPDYVAARIRQPPPKDMPIVPGSTPVVAFGDVRTAQVATLGLNPSKVEFLDDDGQQLTGHKRRLETLASLGVDSLASAPTQAIAQVFEGCNSYFSRRPYAWFNRLETVLANLDVSFYNGSACHLDLVQWATDPTWGSLSSAQQRALILADAEFLRRQLAQEHIRLLLLNGKSVVRAVEKWLGVELAEAPDTGDGRIRIFTGFSDSGVRVVGWNINLQSSFGVTNKELAAVGSSVRQIAAADDLLFKGDFSSARRAKREIVADLLRVVDGEARSDDRSGDAFGIRLMEGLYEFGLLRSFDWMAWHEEAARYHRDPGLVGRASLETILKILTFHARNDRFCDGHFAAMVRDGHIQAVIRRLAEML